MQLLDNGTQGGTTVPAPQSAVGTPGYAASGTPGSVTPSVLDPDTFNRMMAELMAFLTEASISADRTNNAQVLQAGYALFGKNVRTLTGSGNLTVPANVTKIRVTAVGAGGGGGASYSTTAGQSAIADGGNGGTRAVGIISVTPGQVIAYSCGSGGAGGVAGVSNPGAGGTTTFGTLTAPGGHGGNNAPANGTFPYFTGPAQATSQASGGNVINSAETPGLAGYTLQSATNCLTGSGGPGYDGTGGGPGIPIQSTGSAGNPGIVYGAGGGGAGSAASDTAHVGGAGAAGVVIVEW